MNSIFSYYHYSSNKSASLKVTQQLLSEQKKGNSQCLTMKKAEFQRWLTHEQAVSNLRKSFAAVITDLENAVASKLATTGSGPTPAGLLKNLKTFKFFFGISWLSDVLAQLSLFTLAMESNSLTVSTLESKLTLTLVNLKKLEKKPGVFGRIAEKAAQKMGISPSDEEKACVTEAFKKWVPNLIEKINSRFENQEVIFALGSLQLSNVGSALISMYGDEKIILLAQYFHLNEESLLQEWDVLKDILTEKSEIEKCTLEYMYKTVLHVEKSAGNNQFKDIKYLLAVALTLPMSTAVVERIFSQAKGIITPKRNRLEVHRLNDHLMIKFSNEIDVQKEAELFLSKKKRRILS